MVWIKLYWSFLLIGFSSFGGLSMIPLITEQVLSNGWMTVSQVTDILAIAEMTPGPLGLNCATFAGSQAAGILGAVIANLGILTPSLTLGAIVAVFFHRCKDSQLLTKLLVGVRPVCLGMVVGVLLSMAQSTYLGPSGIRGCSVAIGALDWILLQRYHMSIPKIILFSSTAGLVLYGLLPMVP